MPPDAAIASREGIERPHRSLVAYLGDSMGFANLKRCT